MRTIREKVRKVMDSYWVLVLSCIVFIGVGLYIIHFPESIGERMIRLMGLILLARGIGFGLAAITKNIDNWMSETEEEVNQRWRKKSGRDSNT